MNVDNNLRLLRGSDIEILTIATRGSDYDIMVLDVGTKLDLDAPSDGPIFVEDEVLQRLNIDETTVDGVIKYVVKNFPHLKYRPEFNFIREETADCVLDFIWMSDRVYDENVRLSKSKVNLHGWMPVQEEDVADLKLFGSPVSLLKSAFKRSEDFQSDIKIDDVFILSNVSLDRRSLKSEPLASGFCHIEYLGKDPDKSFYRVELRRAEEYEASSYEHPYYLVLSGVNMAADAFISLALNTVSTGIGDEDAFISKFLQYAAR